MRPGVTNHGGQDVSSSDIGPNYATALIDSLKSGEDIEAVGRDLEIFAGLLKELPALARLLSHPGLDLDRRGAILDEALSKMDPHPTTRRFLHLILEKGRVPAFGSIHSIFSRLRDARLNVATAEVVTAIPVNGAARTRWGEALSRLTGKKVRVSYRTDSALLGGALTRVGSVVYDGSLKKQLSRIRGILLGE